MNRMLSRVRQPSRDRGLLRLAFLAVIVVSLLAGCLYGETVGYRTFPTLNLEVFACSPDPGPVVIRSAEELARTLEKHAPHCPSALFYDRKQAFLQTLKAAPVNWSRDTLVIAQDWYGTGMATASLEFVEAEPARLDVTVRWKVPPPPVTPDTRVYRAAFALNKAKYTTVTVTLHDGEKSVFAVSPDIPK